MANLPKMVKPTTGGVATGTRSRRAVRRGYRPKMGTLRGGVISPLLANAYLHWFDRAFHGKNGPATWANARLVRYAADFVVMAR